MSVKSPTDAADLTQPPATSAWPEVPAWSPAVIGARNANEARLFVQVQGGTELRSAAVGTQLHVLAAHPEGERVHRFTLAGGAPLAPTDFGPGASGILDAAELLFFADRVVRELPPADDRFGVARPVARRLRLAAAAVREGSKLAVDPARLAFHTSAARDYAAAHPDRFTAAALARYAQALDEQAARWERA